MALEVEIAPLDIHQINHLAIKSRTAITNIRTIIIKATKRIPNTKVIITTVITLTIINMGIVITAVVVVIKRTIRNRTIVLITIIMIILLLLNQIKMTIVLRRRIQL
jgi:hypothetical protein